VLFILIKYLIKYLLYILLGITDINKAKMAYRLLNEIIIKLEPKIIRKIQSLKVLVHVSLKSY